MPSLYAALEDRLSDAVDTMFGEQFAHIPMSQATPNSRRTADATRTGSTLTAVIDDRNAGPGSFARLGQTSGGVASSSSNPQATMTNPILLVESRRFLHGLPRRLDRFRRVDTGTIYEATDIEQDGQGRLKIGLVRIL